MTSQIQWLMLLKDISKFGLIDMFNVHASAGKFAMQTVMNRIKRYSNRPLVLLLLL